MGSEVKKATEYIEKMRNAADAKLSQIRQMAANYPVYAFLFAEAEKAVNDFKSSMTKEMNLFGHLGSSSFNNITKLISIHLMVDRVSSEFYQSRSDYHTKLINLTPEQFQREIRRVNDFTKDQTTLYDDFVTDKLEKGVERSLQILGNTNGAANFFKRYSYEHIYQFDHNFFKNNLMQIVPNIKTQNEEFSRSMPLFAKVANMSSRCYDNLLNMTSCFNDDMKINDAAMKELSRMLAAQQIMDTLKAEENQPNKPFTDKMTGFDQKEYDAFVDLLSTGVEASGIIRDAFSGKDAVINERNLLNVLFDPKKTSAELLDHGYFKQLMDFAIKDNNAPQPLPKEFKDMEKKLKRDALVKMEVQKAEDFHRAHLEKGAYNIGKTTFDYTKDELLRFGIQLSQKYLSGNTELFNDLDKADKFMGKELKELKNSLDSLSTAFIKFGKSRDLYESKRDETNTRDTLNLNEAEAQLDIAVKNCEEILLTDIGDTPEFQALYANIVDASARVQSVKNGMLFIPDPKEQFEKGKKIHRIKSPNPDASILAENYYGKGKVPENAKVNWKESKDPLFSHDPCPDDIAQGSLGDCYFISALMAIASKNPDKIREMMHYNEKDNTVTVKLYSMTNEPVYVTVENSVPVLETTENGKVTSSVPVTNKGARWVAIMEKAFAGSGIHLDEKVNINDRNNVSDEYMLAMENGTLTPIMEDIEAGMGHMGLRTLLGPDVVDLDKGVRDVLDNNLLELVHNNDPIFPAQYSESDLKLYNTLHAVYENHQPITCAINKKENSKGDTDMTSGILGLPSGHAYAVVGFSEDGNTKYIHVKNPHSGRSRGYDGNHTPILIEDRDGLGISKLELKDFLNCFDQVGTTNYNEGPVRKQKEEIFERNNLLYGEAIKTIDFFIQDETVGTKKNPATKQYLDLRTYSKQLIAALQGEQHDLGKLNWCLDKYFESAEKYVNFYNGTSMKKESDAQKYIAASMINKMKEVYQANQEADISNMKPCDYDELKADVMQLKGDESNTLKSATKVISDKERAEKLAARKRKDKILGMVDDYENKFSKYLAKASKSKDYNKMVESISQYLYIEGVKQDAPNMSESVLKNKLNPKTIQSNVDDSKYYVSEVLKDIPEEQIKENLYTLKDPKKIISNFKRMREEQRQKANQERELSENEAVNENEQINKNEQVKGI